jgi:hypothetical protein
MAADEIGRWVAEFARHVAAQTDEIQRGDAGKGNMHAKRYSAAFQRLRDCGDPGREALVPLMHSERPDVRCAAAGYLLRFRTGEALEVLRALSGGTGLVSFEAGECLERWDEGTWALDPA